MHIREASILSEDAQALIAQLDQELRVEYAPEHMHVVDFEPFHREGGIFMIAYDGGESTAGSAPGLDRPVACGALRPLSQQDVELKRMFVLASHRGRGISRLLLAALEEKAKSVGYARLMLETGDQQHAAIGLYQSSGYARVEPFGEYVGGPRSICFAKEL